MTQRKLVFNPHSRHPVRPRPNKVGPPDRGRTTDASGSLVRAAEARSRAIAHERTAPTRVLVVVDCGNEFALAVVTSGRVSVVARFEDAETATWAWERFEWCERKAMQLAEMSV